MKNHSKTASGAYEDHSQFDSDDSNSSNTENTQNSTRSFTTPRPQQQQMPPEIPVTDGGESGRNLNKQPATLDLSINAPSQALSNILLSRPVRVSNPVWTASTDAGLIIQIR
uniref:Uncharacterized protein n=1 Tax=Anopheles maculatus TaxID=74869 RepID=A0A182SWH9_9DIPT